MREVLDLSDELKIETKTKIAADAAITVNAYLEELNERLTANRIESAFSIVSDTQEIIIDILNKVGSPTKLGTDTCMQLIHDELGTPDEFVDQYVQDHSLTARIPLSDNDTKILMKRPRIRKNSKDEQNEGKNGVFGFLRNILNYSFLILPLILISSSLLIRLEQGRVAYDYSGYEIFVLSSFSLLFFTINELYSGFSGKLIATKKTTITLRYLYRGSLISHFILGFHATITRGFRYSEDAAWYFFFAIIFLEILIFLRDHVDGLYPLESEFRKRIRFLTPPYLMLLLVFIIFPYSDDDTDIVITLITVAVGIWIRRKKYKVSPRFYLVLFTLLFTSLVSEHDFIIMAGIIPLYYLYAGLNSKYNLSFNKGGLNKPFKYLKAKLNEYYEEQDQY